MVEEYKLNPGRLETPLTEEQIHSWVNRCLAQWERELEKTHNSYISWFSTSPGNVYIGACHRDLTSTKLAEESKGNLIFTLNVLKYRDLDNAVSKETLRSYWSYILNESPFRFAFHNDLDFMMEYGFLTYAKLPKHYLLAAITAARLPFDTPRLFDRALEKSWLPLLEEGLEPGLAFITIPYFTRDTFQTILTTDHHWLFPLSALDYSGKPIEGLTPLTIQRFLSGNLPNLDKSNTVFDLFLYGDSSKRYFQSSFSEFSRSEHGKNSFKKGGIEYVKEFWNWYLPEEDK